jgi:hypothetical protein
MTTDGTLGKGDSFAPASRAAEDLQAITYLHLIGFAQPCTRQIGRDALAGQITHDAKHGKVKPAVYAGNLCQIGQGWRLIGAVGKGDPQLIVITGAIVNHMCIAWDQASGEMTLPEPDQTGWRPSPCRNAITCIFIKTAAINGGVAIGGE